MLLTIRDLGTRCVYSVHFRVQLLLVLCSFFGDVTFDQRRHGPLEGAVMFAEFTGWYTSSNPLPSVNPRIRTSIIGSVAAGGARHARHLRCRWMAELSAYRVGNIRVEIRKAEAIKFRLERAIGLEDSLCWLV